MITEIFAVIGALFLVFWVGRIILAIYDDWKENLIQEAGRRAQVWLSNDLGNARKEIDELKCQLVCKDRCIEDLKKYLGVH